jgi:hypothetical protein
MDQPRLSPEDSSALAAEAAKQLRARTADTGFCEDWPKAKAALIFVSGYLKPSFPAVAKVIGDVITLGDLMYQTGCTPIRPPRP